MDIRSIAFYLPQFHPIPENDAWWGKGFTEWHNVAKARPLFRGHYQPHLPADLGFYDLRLPELQQAQADLAGEYGIFGFCYYHYWFSGKRLLGGPFDSLLRSGKPDFPFCLCWANENWTRRWDGQENDVLMRQTYSEKDDQEHIQWLISVFKDKRYIRVHGKPLFLVYRARHMPDPSKTAKFWRKEVRKYGLEDIFLCQVESFSDDYGDPSLIGFDAAVEFQPDWKNLGELLRPRGIQRFLEILGLSRAYRDNRVYDYHKMVQKILMKKPPADQRFPCVCPSWDNSARRRTQAVILKDSSPAIYEWWLRTVKERYQPKNSEENFIFINAWNEWGEGNHLEPCRKWGRAYLEATRRALQAPSSGIQ